MVYAEFGGQTECIMGNWKIENFQNKVEVFGTRKWPREKDVFFQSLTKVAWKKKSEYSQQESNL